MAGRAWMVVGGAGLALASGAGACAKGRATECKTDVGICTCPDGSPGSAILECTPGDPNPHVTCQCGAVTSSTAGGGGKGGAGGSSASGGGGGEGGVMCVNPKQSFCGGNCIDAQSNHDHCGSCDNACPAAATCDQGKCLCPKDSGAIACGGECLDPLVNDKNCGGCGHDCLGAKCSAGLCPSFVISSFQEEAYGIAVDATYVYWSSAGVNNYIIRDKITDPNATSAIAVSQGSPREVALVATAKLNGLAWANHGAFDMNQSIAAIEPPASAVTIASLQKSGPWAIAAVDKMIYWTNRDQGEVWSADVSAPKDTTNKKIASALKTPWDIVADASFVYWSNYDGGDVVRLATGGGVPAALVKNLAHPAGVALDAKYLYYAAETSGEIARVALDGSQKPELIASGQIAPAQLALDAKFVYWTSAGTGSSDGTVAKAPLGGGSVTVLAALLNKPQAIAVGATHVYWTTLGSQKVMRVPK